MEFEKNDLICSSSASKKEWREKTQQGSMWETYRKPGVSSDYRLYL